MSMRLSSVLLISAAFSGSLLVSTARAADPDFCRTYAQAAMRQSKVAHEHEQCRAVIRDNPDRWSSDFRVHMDWCRNASFEDAGRERDARKHVLEDCAHR